MTGKEIASLMRKHKVTIFALSQRMNVTQGRVREVRKVGVDGEYLTRDWVQGITGKDPGTQPVEPESVSEPKPPIEEMGNGLGWIVRVDGREFGAWKPSGGLPGIQVQVKVDGVSSSDMVDPSVTCPMEAVQMVLTVRLAESMSDREDEEERARRAKPDDPMPRHLLLLPPNLGIVAKLAGDNGHARFGATTGVKLTSTHRGYRVEATDGRRLAIVTGEVEDAKEFPSIPALESAPNGECSSIVPAREWLSGFKSVPKRTKPILRNVATVMGKNVTTMATTDLDQSQVIQPRNIDGRFPTTDVVVKDVCKKAPKAKVRICSKYLREVLEVAAAFCPENETAVELELREEGTPVVIRSRNGSQEFTGLVVPLVTK